MPLNKPLKFHAKAIVVRRVFVSVIRTGINTRQMKIKNRLDYLFHGNMIVNIKDFDSNLLEINEFSFKGVLVLVFITVSKYISRKNPNRVKVDRTDCDEDFLYFFLDDVDEFIEENNGTKYLVFTPAEKTKDH